MNIKPNTYYKRVYNTTTSDENFTIYYTDDENVYLIAGKFINRPLIKYKENDKWWGTIKTLQLYSKDIIELTKEDLFLELL